ncbi:MAG: hypothetical protein WBA16_02880 [Nonlabens sp.]
MKKKFYHPPIWLAAAIAFAFAYDGYEIITSSIGKPVNSYLEILVAVTHNATVVAVLVLLILYMRNCNREGFIDLRGARILQSMGIGMLIAAIGSFVSSRFYDGSSLTFALEVLFTILLFQFHKLTKEAIQLRKENDLTI